MFLIYGWDIFSLRTKLSFSYVTKYKQPVRWLELFQPIDAHLHSCLPNPHNCEAHEYAPSCLTAWREGITIPNMNLLMLTILIVTNIMISIRRFLVILEDFYRLLRHRRLGRKTKMTWKQLQVLQFAVLFCQITLLYHKVAIKIGIPQIAVIYFRIIWKSSQPLSYIPQSWHTMLSCQCREVWRQVSFYLSVKIASFCLIFTWLLLLLYISVGKVYWGILNSLSCCWLYNRAFPRFDFEIIKIESTWEQKEFRINT